MDSVAKTEILNTALTALGKENVPGLDDGSIGGNLAARKLLPVMERARRTVLSKNGWAEALEYVVLQPSVVPGLAFNRRYPTTFLMPGDFVRAWEVEGVPCQWNDQLACYPLNTWEPRWQVATTEVNGSAQHIMRAARGAGDGMFGDGVGYADDPNFTGALGGGSWSIATLDPLVYVRLADWGALTATVSDLIAYETAARGAFAVTADLALQGKLDKYVGQRLADAVGADATQEGGQPPPMPSIPQTLRNYSR